MEEFRYTYVRLCKDNHIDPQECVLSFLKRYCFVKSLSLKQMFMWSLIFALQGSNIFFYTPPPPLFLFSQILSGFFKAWHIPGYSINQNTENRPFSAISFLLWSMWSSSTKDIISSNKGKSLLWHTSNNNVAI